MIETIQSMSDYHNAYQRSIDKPEEFWSEIAENFSWYRKWNDVLKWDFSTAEVKWFDGALCNITSNCIDRFALLTPHKSAIIWEANSPQQQSKRYSFKELQIEVAKFANVLKSLGVKKGDRVAIYLPMLIEGAIAMLACARIGAVHIVIFAGFSSESIIDRVNDCDAKVIITADSMVRGEKKISLKEIVDEAIGQTPQIEYCIVLKRGEDNIEMKHGKDLWWHDLMLHADSICEPEQMNAEDPLFILYTSGSTGKPKGVLHTVGGYMVYAAYTFANVFNIQKDDIFWCTADIGWITGHSYSLYGSLLNGTTTVFFEGVPTYPDHGRFWDVIDKHKISILYTAPTAIRALESFGDSIFKDKNLSSLRVLGSVGEPINEEAWHWYHKNVGKGNCPIVDTWWQTETGGILISPIANVTNLIPAFATLPLPGVQPILVNEKGEEMIGNNVEGNLCIKFPWPGMARTIYKNHGRFVETYFSMFPRLYFTGDGCKRNEDGFYRITGRVDDVINVSGHRIGTGEVEDAVGSHPNIVECAVVGFHHEIKGQALYIFAVCIDAPMQVAALKKEVETLITTKIGIFARPDKIQIVTNLPKTRSGKIVRRLLRKIAEDDISNLGDISTLVDADIISEIIAGKMSV